MKKPVYVLIAGLGIGAAGCTMAPKYSRPGAPVPPEWPTGPAYATPATKLPTAYELPWEQFIREDRLRQVIRLALANSRDLRLAALNAEQARALYGVRRAELLPAMDVTASGSRQRIPADLSGSASSQTASRYSVNLGITAWEIDFFGRIRSMNERALREYFATREAQRGAQIFLISSVARTYLLLAADRESLALAETTLKNQAGAYELVKQRFDLGLIPELEVFRASTQVETARADIARFTGLVAQDENMLRQLVGAGLPAELLPKSLDEIAAPERIGVTLPSDVLLVRPDVAQSEQMLRAANADIGAARAAFFPRISLTTAIGTASTDLSGLFKAGSGTWSYAPQIVMPIFDARTWSALRASKVQQQQAITQYERAIQVAFREVADALAVRGTIGKQLAAQNALVDAVAATYRLSNSRFEQGIDNYLSVLDAQRSLYAAQQALVAVRLAELASQIEMYAVLGGGAAPGEPQG